MEPTLHCAKPGSDCEARFSDRVLACRFCYRFWNPKRGDIVVFKTPPLADVRCGAGGTFVKRLIGLPGETWEERNGYVYINGVRQAEPYIKSSRRDDAHDRPDQDPTGPLLHDGRQPQLVVRLARVGHGAAREPDRQGLRDLLAAEQGHHPLMLGRALVWLATLLGFAVVAARRARAARDPAPLLDALRLDGADASAARGRGLAARRPRTTASPCSSTWASRRGAATWSPSTRRRRR